MFDGTLALVTGGNRGIGRAAARQLAETGMTVLIGCRVGGRGDRAARELQDVGLDVRPVLLDVTDEAAVAAAAEHVRADHGRLDVLVNNAGTFVGAPTAGTTAGKMRQVFEVNLFGVVRVTRAMLDLLRFAASPRVVNVSSTVASLELTSNGADLPGDAERRCAYACSKTALNMLTVQYARAFARDPQFSHLKINAVTPGYTATDMNDFRGHRSVEDAAKVIVRLATIDDTGPTGGFFDDDGTVPW
jgi:NAD(P)-dependent dehydrogenase (short-subunit alcohol dehydrogenase family)